MTKRELIKMLELLDSIQDIYDEDDEDEYAAPAVARFDKAANAFRRHVVRELGRIEAMQVQAWNGAKWCT